jgi:phosphatidylglycerol---prolipoprotein diacylglyceryl transferase
MYPILFEFFGFPISTFGVMMAVGFLVSAWIVARRLAEYGLDPELSSTILIYAMIGGVAGSKLYFSIDEALRTGAPFLELLFSRAGITWYGGLIGGALLVMLATRIHKIPTRVVASCVANAAPFGQACGRIGCFLVGDDYGRKTDVAWAVGFPEGAPPTIDPATGAVFTVHPTQLYEVAWLLLIGAVLWRRRRTSPFLFGEYLMAAAGGRFAIEFLRVNEPLALGFTQPQWIAVGLFMLGACGWLYFRGRPEPLAVRAPAAQ